MKLFDVYPLYPIELVKAKGSTVWDKNGQEYVDLYGGHAVISIGHSHPTYVARMSEQLTNIGFYSNSIIISGQEALAEKLGRLSGYSDYTLFLTNSGAESNENALKLASFVTGRKKIISFTGSFHGRTSLAVAATDNPSIVAPVNETENIIFLPFNDEAALQACFDDDGDSIAAVIIEGIQGVGGIRVATNSFLQLIRTLCTKHGALYIADSVQCGYGRTGQFFAHDAAGVDADIYSMAKGMGNGFPIGGILIAPHIAPKYGMLGTTFGGNHLACAAALAVVEVMDNENLLDNAASNGAYLMEALSKIDILENVRGRGLMIGFDVPDSIKDLKKVLLQEFKVFTGEAKPNVIRLLPSLSISKEEVDIFLDRLQKAIQSLL